MSAGLRTETAILARNHLLAAQLGISGAAVAFGLLNMAMSLLAGLAALRQRDGGLTTGRRTAYAVVILATGPGLLHDGRLALVVAAGAAALRGA